MRCSGSVLRRRLPVYRLSEKSPLTDSRSSLMRHGGCGSPKLKSTAGRRSTAHHSSTPGVARTTTARRSSTSSNARGWGLPSPGPSVSVKIVVCDHVASPRLRALADWLASGPSVTTATNPADAAASRAARASASLDAPVGEAEDAVLGDFGIEHAMLELGGVVRTRGQAGGQPWWLALDRPGLRGQAPLRLRLDDAALVHLDSGMEVARETDEDGDPAPADRLLAVSVMAPSALEADRRARELMAAGPEAVALAAERAVRIVVLTSQGIEIHHGSALEAYLEEAPGGGQE